MYGFIERKLGMSDSAVDVMPMVLLPPLYQNCMAPGLHAYLASV